MKRLSDHEKNIIKQIYRLKSQGVITVKEFLEQVFFSQDSHRCLIVQPGEKYAMFFLGVEAFNSNAKAIALSEFLELLCLLRYLNSNGYITLFRGEHLNHEKMFFFSQAFSNPRIERGKIVLNDDGLYSTRPECIKDHHDEVVFKGIELKNENFDLIYQHCIGSMCVSESLSQLLESAPEIDQPNNQQQSKAKSHSQFHLAIALVMFATALILFGWFSKNQFSALKSELGVVQSTLKVAVEQLSATSHTDAQVKKDSVELGIDLSHWNGDILSATQAFADIGFIISKATEGAEHIDPSFANNWHQTKVLGKQRGAYHFYLAHHDPIQQAHHFWAQLADYGVDDFAPVLDIEQASLDKLETVDTINLQIDLLRFLHELEALSGRRPMVYTNPTFANQYLTHKTFAQYPLWIADYNAKDEPQLPKTWQQTGYRIWQKSAHYQIANQTSDLDVLKK